MPQVNPDGTVQVAPPTQSAFAPQPTQAPPPMQAPVAAPPTATPAGAIFDAIKALAMHFAPKSVTQIKQRNDQAEAKGLGNEF
jgi:hypothetical protein